MITQKSTSSVIEYVLVLFGQWQALTCINSELSPQLGVEDQYLLYEYFLISLG